MSESNVLIGDTKCTHMRSCQCTHVRAFFILRVCYFFAMEDSKWRDRLMKALDADGRADSAISLAAGLGRNYIQQMRQRGTTPNVDQLSKLCETLHVSLVYVLTGLDLDAEGERFISLAAKRTPEEQRHLLELLRLLPQQPSSQ